MSASSAAAPPAPAATTAEAATPTAETPTTTPSETSTTSEPTTSSSTTSSSSSSSSTSTSSTSLSTTSTTTATQPPTTSTTSIPSTSSETSTISSDTNTTPVVTSIITKSATDGTTGPQTVVVTSTDTSLPTHSTGNSANSISATATGSSATTSATSGSASGGSGLSAGGTIAVAVVVPVASVAIIILAALYFWRKWKAKKAAEEERRKEVEEYGFNPNNDPTLPPIMGGGAFEPKDDTSGYRGWGTTSAGRKASTNLSSGAGVGLAMSEAGSAPGYHHVTTPSDGTIQYSEGPAAGETEPIGVLGAAPIATTNNRTTDIHRGPSNASSAYSAANRSEASDESHMSATHPTGPFYDDNPYYNEMQPQYGAYGDGPYGGSPPVIRDVQARRNTRIENPAVFPRQGNAGIAQNF
ncbi:hypothetical protein F9C07_5130 [Aspergillus flavus]|uniref:Uncharacterized protein n=2 Tax=Aspergillus flavus TaxID=5059 RepID=B8NAA0_ASPFN|nr:uncharacterized protein G4B84_005057 [Aspergillus flavus NRRL3357]KAB8243088.1 hypothetical protein BDV35DRAFT_383446 [Aspergillus flavus]KOC11335.1 hypothetical protein AFLA70_126g002481 [Aspergillus flavus AF70]KAF7618451.1 hypothetical protein AFLA_007343 [Aspergillus flavus NRRL3357]QMW29722.1 hypothetical protein G4B84_005057 [Aspergillus flavus NRRL3357]QRD86110.1 hypothetical protein F9C07_5130 [Aspergillus flavus]